MQPPRADSRAQCLQAGIPPGSDHCPWVTGSVHTREDGGPGLHRFLHHRPGPVVAPSRSPATRRQERPAPPAGATGPGPRARASRAGVALERGRAGGARPAAQWAPSRRGAGRGRGGAGAPGGALGRAGCWEPASSALSGDLAGPWALPAAHRRPSPRRPGPPLRGAGRVVGLDLHARRPKPPTGQPVLQDCAGRRATSNTLRADASLLVLRPHFAKRGFSAGLRAGPANTPSPETAARRTWTESGLPAPGCVPAALRPPTSWLAISKLQKGRVTAKKALKNTIPVQFVTSGSPGIELGVKPEANIIPIGAEPGNSRGHFIETLSLGMR